MKKTYLSLGGNIGDTASIIIEAFHMIKNLKGIFNAKLSYFYKTTPVGMVNQPDFINVAISFDTNLLKEDLLLELQNIERYFKKDKKEKNGPRTLDIDILFFGNDSHQSDSLQIPHPRWQERLFVLKPLMDLTKTIILPGNIEVDIEEMIRIFPNKHNEVIKKIEITPPV